MANLIDDAYVTARLTLTPAQVAALPGYLAAASRAVESYCHRIFSATDFDERYSSDGSGRLFLRQRPVISVASVATGRTSPVTLDPSRYDFDPLTAELVGVSGSAFYVPFWGGWDFGGGVLGCGGFRDVRVVYRAGYEVIPEDVQMATLDAVSSMIDANASDSQVQSETLGPHSISYINAANRGIVMGGMAANLLASYIVYRF